MITLSSHSTDLPLDQQAIRDKCFHPASNFIEFKKQEIEQSISDRFEEQVRKFPDRLAVYIYNPGVLRKTIDAIVARHEALRTTLTSVGGSRCR